MRSGRALRPSDDGRREQEPFTLWSAINLVLQRANYPMTPPGGWAAVGHWCETWMEQRIPNFAEWTPPAPGTDAADEIYALAEDALRAYKARRGAR